MKKTKSAKSLLNKPSVKKSTAKNPLVKKSDAKKTNVKKPLSKISIVKKSVVKKDLTVEMYKEALFNRSSKSIKQNTFRSHNHIIYTEEVSKIALSSFDDKCYVKNNNINTYTFGHYKTLF